MYKFVSVMSLGGMCNQCQIMPESECDCLKNDTARKYMSLYIG